MVGVIAATISWGSRPSAASARRSGASGVALLARRLRDLAATPAEETPALEPVDQSPREIAAPEYPVQPPLESVPPREERDS